MQRKKNTNKQQHKINKYNERENTHNFQRKINDITLIFFTEFTYIIHYQKYVTSL